MRTGMTMLVAGVAIANVVADIQELAGTQVAERITGNATFGRRRPRRAQAWWGHGAGRRHMRRIEVVHHNAGVAETALTTDQEAATLPIGSPALATPRRPG